MFGINNSSAPGSPGPAEPVKAAPELPGTRPLLDNLPSLPPLPPHPPAVIKMTPTQPVADNVPAAPGSHFPPAEPPASPPADQPTAGAPPVPSVPGPANQDLMQIKERALENLTPLVGHLEQTPEERFKTTMMMLQATDNPGLVKDAYAAATEIQDEKNRAHALLDVVNEINYFTQHKAEKTNVSTN